MLNLRLQRVLVGTRPALSDVACLVRLAMRQALTPILTIQGAIMRSLLKGYVYLT